MSAPYERPDFEKTVGTRGRGRGHKHPMTRPTATEPITLDEYRRRQEAERS